MIFLMINTENLLAELTQEILWRHKELKNIKKLYEANLIKEIIKIGNTDIEKIKNTSESKYILRSSVPLIYAHWEGFFKKSIELLHKELDLISTDYNKLDNVLLSILTKDKHTNKYKNCNFKFTEILIDTESNLSWKILEKFSIRYNFNLKRFEKHKDTLEQLLKTRNGISHGENAYHFEDFSKIEEYLIVTTKLMIITKNSVVNCLKYKKFYKQG